MTAGPPGPRPGAGPAPPPDDPWAPPRPGRPAAAPPADPATPATWPPPPGTPGPAGPPSPPGAAPTAVGGGPVPRTAGPPAVETPWLRLHPLTPLFRGGRLLALVAVAVVQQVLREAGAGTSGALVAAAIPVAVVYGWVSWRVTRYRVAGGDLQIETGVLVRQSRRIPLARLQAVDVVRGPVARVVGLAELRLEVVGGGRSEAPLAYLTADEATRLRAHLLALARRAGAAAVPGGAAAGEDTREDAGHEPSPEDSGAAGGPTGPGPGPGEVEEALLAVPPTRLVAAALLSGPAVAAAVLLLAAGVALLVAPWGLRDLLPALGPGLLGTGGVLARRVVVEWGFRAAAVPDGLRLRHGLVETRTQTIPRDRVQGVRLVEPLLWRRTGWVRVEVDVAGYGAGGGEEQARTRALVPVAPRAEALAVVARTLPGAGLDGPAPARPPRRGRLLAPWSWHHLGVHVGERTTRTSGGVVSRVTDVVPHAKVQSLRLVQGPLQRRLGLATLHLDTAGRYVAGVARLRDAGEADALLADLVERTRAARSG